MHHPDDLAEGIARIDNILDQEDIPAFDRLVQIHIDLDVATAYGAVAIGRHRHEIDNQRKFDFTDQIRHEDKGATKYPNDHQLS